jgi:Fic family protein
MKKEHWPRKDPDTLETPARIEPARLEEPPEAVADLVAELASQSAALGQALHPGTASNLAGLVRVMNTYYSNLIEGHNTRPRDIERALAVDLDDPAALGVGAGVKDRLCRKLRGRP